MLVAKCDAFVVKNDTDDDENDDDDDDDDDNCVVVGGSTVCITAGLQCASAAQCSRPPALCLSNALPSTGADRHHHPPHLCNQRRPATRHVAQPAPLCLAHWHRC